VTATRIAGCIVAFRQRDDVLTCLSTVSNIDYEPLKVMVLDSASAHDTAEAVRGVCPGVDVNRERRQPRLCRRSRIDT
jgi:GT2 family glycosyltransferase